MLNEKTCTQKWWTACAPFLENRINILIGSGEETDTEKPENMSNEATTCACDICGCDHCGQPLLLRECSQCGSTLCGCHILPEEHECTAFVTTKSWDTYTWWQEKLR